MTIQIRNSDIVVFKHCREEWNYSSGHRLNLRPNKSPVHFGFGTAVHKGAEVWYNPTAPYDDDKAIDAFINRWAPYIQDCFDPAEWSHYRDLGVEMLRGYFPWARKEDDFLPKRVEVEFEIPIVVPREYWFKLPPNFHVDADTNWLYYKGELVVFAGRVDLVGELEPGSYVIVDHKTANRVVDLTYLEMDEQLAKYGYALSALGLSIVAIYYNQLMKSIPTGPEVLTRKLKNGKTKVSLSKNRAASGVTAERYIKAVAEHGLSMADYAEHVQWLQANPPELYRRKVVYKTPEEYRVIQQRLFFEAVDMLNDAFVYANPNSNWGCTNCGFRPPCEEKQSGKSDKLIIRNHYHKREEDE